MTKKTIPEKYNIPPEQVTYGVSIRVLVLLMVIFTLVFSVIEGNFPTGLFAILAVTLFALIDITKYRTVMKELAPYKLSFEERRKIAFRAAVKLYPHV